MQIFVKVPSGKTHTLDVKSSVSIAYVKAKIQELEGIPMREQRLTYNDKDLKDMRTLDESDVMNEDTLHLMLRIVGGAGKKDTVVKKMKPAEAKQVADAVRNFDNLARAKAPDGIHELARQIAADPQWVETALKKVPFDKTKRMLQDLEELPTLNAERIAAVAGFYMISEYGHAVSERSLHDTVVQLLKNAFMLSFAKWGEGPMKFFTLAKEHFAVVEKLEIRLQVERELALKYGLTIKQDTKRNYKRQHFF